MKSLKTLNQVIEIGNNNDVPMTMERRAWIKGAVP